MENRKWSERKGKEKEKKKKKGKDKEEKDDEGDEDDEELEERLEEDDIGGIVADLRKDPNEDQLPDQFRQKPGE